MFILVFTSSSEILFFFEHSFRRISPNHEIRPTYGSEPLNSPQQSFCPSPFQGEKIGNNAKILISHRYGLVWTVTIWINYFGGVIVGLAISRVYEFPFFFFLTENKMAITSKEKSRSPQSQFYHLFSQTTLNLDTEAIEEP